MSTLKIELSNLQQKTKVFHEPVAEPKRTTDTKGVVLIAHKAQKVRLWLVLRLQMYRLNRRWTANHRNLHLLWSHTIWGFQAMTKLSFPLDDSIPNALVEWSKQYVEKVPYLCLQCGWWKTHSYFLRKDNWKELFVGRQDADIQLDLARIECEQRSFLLLGLRRSEWA